MKKTLFLIVPVLLAALAVPCLAEETVQEYEQNMQAAVAENNAANAPKVKTLANGVKVQRTPATTDTDYMATSLMYGNVMNYNMEFLKADRRGCGACHDSLSKLVDSMTTVAHNKLDVPALGIDWTVRQCMYCHDYSTGLYDEAMGFGSLMHMLHGSDNKAFDALGGDCWSCHYASEDGSGMVLWDNVKHDVLRGISQVAADDVTYSFDWNQEKTLRAEDSFQVEWFWTQTGVDRYAANELDLRPESDNGVLDQWTVSVSGAVSNPFTMTVTELIEKFGSVTTKMKNHCGINAIGCSWIGNFEITGIPVKAMLEYAGASEDATIIDAQSADYSWYASTMEGVQEAGAYIVYEIDGEPLPYSLGYPVVYMCGANGAWANVKEVTNIDVVTTPLPNDDYPMEQVLVQGYRDQTADGTSYYKPNVGLCQFTEGQIIPAGEAYTFEGYADAWNIKITGVEFSFDRGQTWIHCDTPDSDLSRWVYWNLTWTPPAEGAYTIMIRSVAEDGTKTEAPLDYLVNVQ